MSRMKLASIALLVGIAGCGDNDGARDVIVTGVHSLAIGQSIQLSAQTVGGGDSSYQWSVDNATVATIDDSGMVTGVGPGEALITARGTSTSAEGTHVIVVGEAAVLISGQTLIPAGGSAQLTATTLNGVDDGYVWESSDELVATVDESGLVMGQGIGEVTMTATGTTTGASAEISISVSAEVPNYEAWVASGHADSAAEAFRHWDGDDPRVVPAGCAKCHSAPGFRDFLGDDGSAPGQVDQAAPVGTVIDCETCHNSAAETLSSVTFPSGVVVDELGAESRCMTCHQGRASTDSVDADIAAAAVGDDEVSPELHFINIHYYAAGATINAGRVRGGYQYANQVYDWRFRHVPGYDTCTGCHDPHSLNVRVGDCSGCHIDVSTVDDLRNVRMIASVASDYDGDGDTSEGIYYEIQGLSDLLMQAIQRYAMEQGLEAICYGAGGYPYWFVDGDGSGDCGADELSYGNRYQSWTPRLLRAAYNYQVAAKDPGGFAHNGKYMIQLLHDSTVDINSVLGAPVNLNAADRNDPGHFNGASEAARHWDTDDAVSSGCSKCHGGSEGLRFYLEYGVGMEVPEQDNGMDCVACHDDVQGTFAVAQVDSVLFPSNIEVDMPGTASNLCGTCHSGRTSGANIDDSIAAGSYRFLNVHYLPAAAVKAGGAAQVGYEYQGKTYAGDWVHQPGNDCTFCHDPTLTNHSFAVADAFGKCTDLCHTTALSHEDIRGNPFFPGGLHPLDYDGDGDSTERLMDELAGFAAATLAEIQAAATASGSPLCYSGDAYPYFFQDTNQNGVCDGAEPIYPNRFTAWTPGLMKAAHNYQIYQKEPGSWAHNFDYMAELLYDSAEDLGGAGAVSSLIRP